MTTSILKAGKTLTMMINQPWQPPQLYMASNCPQSEVGKNQYQDDGTIKTKHFISETDNNSSQDTTATDDNKQPPNNLQSLLAMLNDSQTAAQVYMILDQQSATMNSDMNPTNITPIKLTPAASTPADAMGIDQE